MANSKISALTAATTPVAGTETLPIVQGGVTKQVSIANLTAGRAVDTGKLTVTNATGGSTAANYLVVKGSTADNSNYPAIELQGGTLYQAGRAPKLALNNAGLGVGLYSGYLSATYTAQYAIYLDSSLGLLLQSSASGAPTTRVTLDSAGDVTMNTGNIIQGTAAKGFNFTANSAAAGKTSQLLNWYEEGTFTPALAFGGAGTGITYTTQTGYYTRIGRQVTLQIRIVLSSKGSATGGATIGGFPYDAGTGNYPAAIIDPSADFAGLVAGGASFAVISGNTLYLMQQTTTGRAQMTQANFGNTADLRFAITYNV